MSFVWSVVLLASIVLAVAGPVFFGHALVEGQAMWYGLGALCLVIAIVLIIVQKRFRPNDDHPQH